MIGAFKKLTISAVALALLSASPANADNKPKKVEKIKLDTLKPGKIKIDPRLGYVLVRVGPKVAGKNPESSVGFSRIDPATDTFFDFATPEDIPRDFARTAGVVLNLGRSFGDSDGAGVYLIGFYPGRWVISGVGQTCLSMGSYTFDVKQGEVTDIGTLIVGRENGQSSAPELKGATLSPDLVSFGAMMNIVMSDALYAKPASDSPALPAELRAMPVTKAALKPDHRFVNSCQTLINRAASLPPLEARPPMTRDEAIVAISKINPAERVEAARKKAERAAAAKRTAR